MVAAPRTSRNTRIALLSCALTSALALLSDAHAALPEDAPPESRDQVATALRALAPAFAGRARHAASGGEGTIEQAIARFAPAKFHKVDEGELPPRRPGALCASDMALVDDRVCVDRYEASLVERFSDGTMHPHPHYESPLADHVYVARSAGGVLPQAYISASQANAACRAAGKRLCKPVEWRAACGGREGYAYPYGPQRTAGVCHDSGVAPMLVFHADTMKRGWGGLELNDPRNDQLNGTLAKTGAYPGCVNDYGLYDMVGNIHEWSADTNGTFQGGYWLDTAEHGDGCAYRTIAHPYDYHDYSTGFRCCADTHVE